MIRLFPVRLRWVFNLIFLSFLFQSTALFSQQHLNLDFEKLSVEGMARPWGWSLFAYAPNTFSQCDSNTVYSGKYSLKVHNETVGDSSLYELAFFIEPNQILNKKLELKAWAKTKNFLGHAGVKIQSVGAEGDGFGVLQEAKSAIAEESDEWKPYQIGLDLGDEPHSVFVSVYMAGSGTVWLDGLELKIDGKKVDRAPVAPTFTGPQQAWLNQKSQSFETVTPSESVNYSKEEFADLSYFKTMVGDARIIALGEATHGTREFFQLKHRLLQYAVHQLDVRTFVLEDNQLRVERINDFVLYGKGTAESVIKGLFAVWNTRGMLELIRWVRAYNEKHSNDPVLFVGMDVQNPQLAIDSLDGFLAEKSPELRLEVDELLADYEKQWQNAYYLEEAKVKKWEEQAKGVYEKIEGKKSDWLSRANTDTERMEVEWAIQNARLIQQNIASILSGGFEGRDKAMADNVGWILDKRSRGKRILVWAHDSHVNRGEAAVPTHNYFQGQAMGAHLARRYGDDYVAFGLFTYRGQCRGTLSYSNFKQIEFDIYTGPTGSLDEGLHRVAQAIQSPLLMLDLRPARNPSEAFRWLTQQRPVRYVGYVAEDYGFGGLQTTMRRYSASF